MKKYLLFIISMLCVSIGTWAEAVTVSTDNGLTTVTCTDNGSSEVTVTGSFPAEGSISNIKVVGPFTTGVSDKIAYALGNNYSSFTRLDLSEATVVTTSTLSTYSIVGWSKLQNLKHLILPKDASVPTAEQIKNNTAGSLDIYDAMEYFVIPKSDGTCDIYLTEVGLTSVADADIIIDNKSTSTVTVHLAEGEDENPATEATKTTIEDYLRTQGYKLFVAFDGNLTVAGDGIGSNITTALTQYSDANLEDIENLAVTGTLTSADVTWLNTNKSNLTGLKTLDLTGATFGAGVTKASVAAAVQTGVTVQYPAQYTISDDCKVTIDMGKLLGEDFATVLAQAKTALGSTNICTLIVTGELKANDLIALGGTNMTGAERIDLSGATLASGVNLDYLQVPASLTSIVLPKNQTVNVSLADKFADAANLNYAYSPSTDPDEADPTVADYVWVNKAGGMAAALAAEASLRGSKYIKVASNVALDASDVNFSSITAVKYLDLRFANMTQDVSLSYVHAGAPQETGYRLILPDNWTKEEMTEFASDQEFASGAWNMAAIYSYSGTELNIYELKDGIYMTAALSNPRIVYDGTTAIKVVTTLDTNLLAALNAAASSVKTITVTASSLDALSFTNPNITTLNVEGLNKSTATVTAGTGCNSLTTLNVTGSTVASVVATGINSLTTVNLNGTTISGETNLSNTGLTTFTTNSSTKLQGDINLMKTALTSFSTNAEIGTTTDGTGNILLNGTTSLASINVSSAQFKNSTSMIHIDNSTTEDDDNNDAIDALQTAGSIQVPSGFTSSTRIHPYAEVQSYIAEAAATGDFELDDKCKIEYDAATGVATVTAIHEGCFAKLMAKNNNYLKFPQGTTFKFTSTCQLNADDLESLAGRITDGTTTNDMAYRSNYYYVDLYDLPATEELCDYQTGTITNVINWLRTKDRQFKGLILPKDHTLYGSGISLIQSEKANTAGELSTCSEFIAYYKTQEIKEGATEPSNLTKTILFTHVYNQTATNSEGIQASNNKLTELLTAHGLNGAGTNAADLYSVSTNGTTPFDATALVGSKGYIETFNNEMVGAPTQANIYAYPKAAGEYTTFVGSSSIGVTPTEVLKIAGTVSNDASAVAKAFNTFGNGPRVLDLSEIKPNDDTFLKGVLESLTNEKIEYIILPAGKSKELVCNTTYSAKLTNLKAVISSTSTNLVAYVNAPGSLAEARYLATGGSTDGTIFSPSQTGLQNVTLAGHLNASDIAANTTDHFLDGDGHWTTTSGNQKSVALWGEQGTITTIDLKDAVFEEYTPTGGKLTSDMNFSYAGLGSIRNITLPTSSSMTLIPENCFNGITSFEDLCIPYNYTHIDNQALFGTYCGHITTTDANGALVDNGPKTYTFSKNLEEIGTKPSTADTYGVYSLSETVFPQNRGVTDVYVLAHKVPKCYANAFPANMLYGWGGFKGGDFPYCREKYDNSSDGSMIFTVLHFPDKASFNASSDKESSYEQMKKYYTDVNKVYTKKEQTGAVDANGDPIAWPTFAELRRAYNQATSGDQWYDWNIIYDGQNSINGGNYIPVGNKEYTRVATGTDPNTTERDYSFTDYEGWHQFSLSMATYVAPDKTTTQNNYAQAGWYTLCIPFSLTEEQLIKILGVPKSTETEKSYVGGVEQTGTDLLPDLRTLRSVTRKPGTTNKVTLMFTNDLTQTSPANYQYWTINDSDPESSDYGGNGMLNGNKIAIRGGYPYLVKPYLPKGVTVTNLGEYIMTRFSKMFTTEQSCLNRDGCYEDLVPYDGTNKTGRFAKPYENHKIQAYLDVSPGGGYTTHSGTDKDKKYYYTFVGQFWEQKLPLYSFYMVENNTNTGKWYWYHSGNKNYTWAPYKCVIMVTQEVDDTANHPNSGKYRDPNIVYPTSKGIDAQKGYIFDKEFKLVFRDGLDDMADFNSNARMHIFTLDNFEFEFEDDNTTSIEQLDGVDIIPANSKVYNMNGQLVGNSLEGLSKGMYIVNGKKYIVK